MTDPYAILGVKRDATTDEIRAAYRKLAFAHHPDRNPDDGAVEIFKKVNIAFEILSDTDKRRHYDAGTNGEPVDDLFAAFRKVFGGPEDLAGKTFFKKRS